jgi:hypothetical protein
MRFRFQNSSLVMNFKLYKGNRIILSDTSMMIIQVYVLTNLNCFGMESVYNHDKLRHRRKIIIKYLDVNDKR